MNNNQLQIIANTHITPAYVFDTDALVERVGMIRSHLGERFRICYAMKANPFLIQSLERVVDCYEVCSPGELRICERHNIPMERIVLSGVYKEKKDILRAMSTYGTAGVYTIESMSQLLLIEACAKEAQVKVQALIRVTSGNQFGMDEDVVCQVIEQRAKYPHITFIGLQQYTGTQKKKRSKIRDELMQLDALITLLRERCSFEVIELEYGPGFYVPYFQKDEEVDDGLVLDEFAAVARELQYQGSITLEMGRYIAAYCGYYVTTIVDQKVNGGQNYGIVDGGIHHLSYFGQAMAMKVPHYRCLRDTLNTAIQGTDSQGTNVYTVCGSLCTVNDVIIKNLPLPKVEINDILVFERVGAYSVTEGINLFLSRDLPKVLIWSKSSGTLVLRDHDPTDVINDGKGEHYENEER